MQNPWKKKDKESPDEFKAKRDALNMLIKKAQALLSNNDFKEYRQLYEEYHANEIENIMALNEQDPIKYAFKVRQIVDTLKAYRLLISSIEENASMQVQEEPK